MSQHHFFIQELFKIHEINPCKVVIIDDNARLSIENRIRSHASFPSKEEADRRTRPCRWSSTPTLSRSNSSTLFIKSTTTSSSGGGGSSQQNATWRSSNPSFPLSSTTTTSAAAVALSRGAGAGVGVRKSSSFTNAPLIPRRLSSSYNVIQSKHETLEKIHSLSLYPPHGNNFHFHGDLIPNGLTGSRPIYTNNGEIGFTKKGKKNSTSSFTKNREEERSQEKVKMRVGLHSKNQSLRQALGSMDPTSKRQSSRTTSM